MNAKIHTFPGAMRPLPTEPAQPKVEIRQEGHTPEGPEKPVEPPKPPVYVRVRADAFTAMLNALSFYAGQGWDGGNKARQVINDCFADQSA